MRSILALDFGATTGWAHSWGQSGTWNLKIREDESSGMRLLRFEAKLRELVEATTTTVIVWETISVASGKRANVKVVKAHTKLQAIVERLAVELGYEHKSYNNSTIKQRAGAKNKDEILEQACEQWPDQDIEDDNQADALWCLLLAQEELGATTEELT